MSLRTSTITTLVAALVVFALIALRTDSSRSPVANTPGDLADRGENATPTPVLVELFTSEGCSSCPPADALLMRLGRTQPVHGADVIALEEHVNYWDRLGWKDPFSSEAATSRQDEYSQSFAGIQAYTPQMIVDAHAEFVGNSESDALRSIRAAAGTPKPAVHLSWTDGGTLAIHVEPLPNVGLGDNAQVYLAVTESMLRSEVKRGENAGRALEHDGVVRQLLPLGKIEAATSGFTSIIAVHLAPEWNRTNLRAVVFVQEKSSRHVLAASGISFPA